MRNENLIFLFLNQNALCGYSKESSQWDASFEHPKQMFLLIDKKIFTIIHSNVFVTGPRLDIRSVSNFLKVNMVAPTFLDHLLYIVYPTRLVSTQACYFLEICNRQYLLSDDHLILVIFTLRAPCNQDCSRRPTFSILVLNFRGI